MSSQTTTETGKDSHYRLHQHTLNPFLESLEPVYLATIERCREHVLMSEIEYWRVADRLLVEHCSYLNVKPHIQLCQTREGDKT